MRHTTRNTLFVLAALIIGIAALIVSCTTAPVVGSLSSEMPIRNSISVSGSGEASASPDLAYVELGVLVTDPEVGVATTRSNQTTSAVRDALTELGVAENDIRTTGFNVWSDEPYPPVFEEEVDGETPRRQVFYRVENGMRVTIRDVDSVGDVIQAALDAGANQVRSVTFAIDDTSTLEEEARTHAIEDARARATDLAEKMNVTIGDPIIISEGISGGVIPFPAGVGLGGGGGAPPISSGELTVTVQVSVTFETA